MHSVVSNSHIICMYIFCMTVQSACGESQGCKKDMVLWGGRGRGQGPTVLNAPMLSQRMQLLLQNLMFLGHWGDAPRI